MEEMLNYVILTFYLQRKAKFCTREADKAQDG